MEKKLCSVFRVFVAAFGAGLLSAAAWASPTHLGVNIDGYFTVEVQLNGGRTVGLVLNPSQTESLIDPALVSAANAKATVSLGATDLGRLKISSTGIKKGSVDDKNVKIVGVLGMDVLKKHLLHLDLQNDLLSLGTDPVAELASDETKKEMNFSMDPTNRPIVEGQFNGSKASLILDWVDSGISGTVAKDVKTVNPVGIASSTNCQFGVSLGDLLPPFSMMLKRGESTVIHLPLDQVTERSVDFDFANKKVTFVFAKPFPLFCIWLSQALPFGISGGDQAPKSGNLGIKPLTGSLDAALFPSQLKNMLKGNEILSIGFIPVSDLWGWWNANSPTEYKKLCDFAAKYIYTRQAVQVTLTVQTPFGIEEPSLYFKGIDEN